MMNENDEELDLTRISLNGYKVFINVQDSRALIAVTRRDTDEKGQVWEEERYFEDLESIGLTYNDLVDAVEKEGALTISGWYPLTPKIKQAVFEHKQEVLKLFEE